MIGQDIHQLARNLMWRRYQQANWAHIGLIGCLEPPWHVATAIPAWDNRTCLVVENIIDETI
jgi:hypothetical protein